MSTDTGDAEPGRKASNLMQATWEAATSEPDPLQALAATRALGALLSGWESELVKEAVAAGATWETIGGTVGVSRQAAWERFHDDVHDLRHRAHAELHDLKRRHREEMIDFRTRLQDELKSRRHAH